MEWVYTSRERWGEGDGGLSGDRDGDRDRDGDG